MEQHLPFSKTNLLRYFGEFWGIRIKSPKALDLVQKIAGCILFIALVLETPATSAQDNTIPQFSKVAGIQITNTNGNWVTVNPASPAYLDLVESRMFTMPPKGSGIARVEFKLYGGDGGTGRYLWGANNRFAKAGGGGIVSFSVDLSKKQDGEYIFAGQHFAVIFGKRGESKQISNGYYASGGGGGSTAMVQLIPGASKLSLNETLLLAAAGGGSGGFGFKDGVVDGNSATANAVTTSSNYNENNWHTANTWNNDDTEIVLRLVTGGSNLWADFGNLQTCCTNDLKPRQTTGMVYNVFDAHVTYQLVPPFESTLQSFIFGQKGGKPVAIFKEAEGTSNSTGVGIWSLEGNWYLIQLGGQGGAGFSGGGAGSSTTSVHDLRNNAYNIPTGGAGGTGSIHRTSFGRAHPNAGDGGWNNYSSTLDDVSVSSRAKTLTPESGMFMYRTIADTESPQINLSNMTVYLRNGTTPLGYNPEVTFQEAVQPYIMQQNGFYDNDGIASVTGKVMGTPITKFECYMGRSEASEVPVDITVTDVAGNSTTKLVMIRVIDPFKPFVVSPDANNNPINVNDGPVTLTASHFPKGYDGCNGNNVTTVFSPTTFYCNDAGQKTISYHFLDRDGNTSPTYNRTFTIVCTNPSNDTGGDNGGNEDTGNNNDNNQNTNQRYLYVDKTAQGNNDGSSWANAFTDLQNALNYNESVTAIYVAKGTYYPTSTTDRAVSFVLKENAKVYGGFPSGGSSFTARNPEANPTILSGKISETQNSYHVVKMTGNNTHLEGFTIQDGRADQTMPDGGGGVWVSGTNTTVRNCKFFNHYSNYFGGAFYANGHGTLNIINCEFKDNLTEFYGGAVFLYSNDMNVKIVNSIFHHNMSYNFGGAISSQNSLEVTNCTFSYNNAGQGAGAIQSSGDTKLHNSILYFNTVTNPDTQVTSQIYCSNAQADYCNIQGSGGSSAWTLGTFNGVQDLGHNIDVDPVYNASPALSINPASPCKDAGKNEYNTERYDIYGNSFRISGDAIDMGAFETGSVNIFVNKDAPNGGDGGSWATAFNNLHDAIDNAKATQRDIWIKEGTYRPDRRPGSNNSTPGNRDNSYYIDADMKIYGGFAGTENSLSQRKNIGLHPVILSGDLGTLNDISDNAYHVVTIEFADNVLLDGLIIQDGSSNESFPFGDLNKMKGAGVFQFSGKAVVQNCVFRNNYATDKGSAWFSRTNLPGAGVDFVQTVFYNNSGVSAPAFFVSMGGATEPYTANFYNVTAFGNTSSNSGGGAFEAEEFTTDYPAKLNFYNSLLAGNSPQNYNDATNPGNITLTNTVTATSGAEVFTNVSNIEGTDGKIMTSDDGLMPNLGNAVSAGDAGLLYDYYGKDWDITGNPRILNKLDAGAYESSHFAPLSPGSQGIIYVRPIAIGEGDGSSWENATSDLHNAIHATNVNKVFVSIGTYKVGAHSFIMKNGVEIYGGFDPANGITDLSHKRIMPNPYNIYGIYEGSILDGQLVRPVIWNIFTAGTAMNNTAVLDGFLLRYGKHPTGGGVRNIYASPTLRNIVMTNNQATVAGAGMYNENSSPVLTNVLICQNRIDTRIIPASDPVYGGGIYNTTNSNPVLTNVTIAENHLLTDGSDPTYALKHGAGMYNLNSSPVIRNSIFFNNSKYYNTATAGADIQDEGSSVTSIKNSITQSYDTGNPADNLKVGVNPNFVNFGAKNFRLTVGSPAIDSGDNALFTDLNADSKDIDGNPRIFDAENGKKIDMGAYEYQCLPVDYSIATMEDITLDYDGNPHSITAGNLVEGVSASYEITDSDNNTTAGNTATNAGTYTITATILPAVSGADCEPVIKTGVLTINKKPSIITTDEIQSHIYDGTQKNVTASLNHTESSLTYVPQQGYTDAGVYPVTVFVPETANYLGASETVNLAIENADFTDIMLEDASFTYDGSPKSLEIAGTLPAGAAVVYGGNEKTDIGIYPVAAFLQLANYNDLWLTATMTITDPLPVTLVSFNVRKQEKAALLEWETVAEYQNAGFEVEHSRDGKNWAKKGFVGSLHENGIGTAQSVYHFSDETPANGINYYRLKQLDDDGRYAYSPIRAVTFDFGPDIIAYPNPVRESVTIELSAEHIGSRVRLVSTTGVVLQQITVRERVFTVSLGGYPAGVYLLHTTDGKVVKVVKE